MDKYKWYLILIFVFLVLLGSSITWFATGYSLSVFNTGMYLCLLFWCVAIIINDY